MVASIKVIQSYGSALSAYGLIFLGAHIWAFSLMFLFSGRGYWQRINRICGHWLGLKVRGLQIQTRQYSSNYELFTDCTSSVIWRATIPSEWLRLDSSF
jgi:hypothetical protein